MSKSPSRIKRPIHVKNTSSIFDSRSVRFFGDRVLISISPNMFGMFISVDTTLISISPNMFEMFISVDTTLISISPNMFGMFIDVDMFWISINTDI